MEPFWVKINVIYFIGGLITMKLRKIFAGIVASAMAISTMAVAANAYIYVDPAKAYDASGLDVGTGSWLIKLYAEEASGTIDNRDGVDVTAITELSFTVKAFATDPDLPYVAEDDDGFGGGLVMSCNGGTLTKDDEKTHNWAVAEYWGLEYALSTEKAIQAVPGSGDGEYVLTWKDIPEEQRFMAGAGCYQVALQEWGNPLTAELEVLNVAMRDADGNFLLGFDGEGNKLSEDPTKGGETPAPKPDDTTPADDNKDDTTPAEPTPGDSTGNSGTTKPNTNTGVEGIAVIAGLAIVATGAIVVSKKRK